jgi:hypothetical protein
MLVCFPILLRAVDSGGASFHHSRPAAVTNDAGALSQNDRCIRPPRDCLAPYRFGQYVIIDAGQVLLDLARRVKHVDSVDKMRSRFHRQRCLPQSSSASRLTAGAAGFFDFTQCLERPET